MTSQVMFLHQKNSVDAFQVLKLNSAHSIAIYMLVFSTTHQLAFLQKVFLGKLHAMFIMATSFW